MEVDLLKWVLITPLLYTSLQSGGYIKDTHKVSKYWGGKNGECELCFFTPPPLVFLALGWWFYSFRSKWVLKWFVWVILILNVDSWACFDWLKAAHRSFTSNNTLHLVGKQLCTLYFPPSHVPRPHQLLSNRMLSNRIFVVMRLICQLEVTTGMCIMWMSCYNLWSPLICAHVFP
jgi:hypothetical protein